MSKVLRWLLRLRPLAKAAISGFAHAVILACALMLTVGNPASAQSPVTLSFSGTLQANQIDTGGFFGPAGANIGGDQYAFTVSYNAADFTQCNNMYCTTSSGVMTTSLTINGVTQTLTNCQSNQSENNGPSTINFDFSTSSLTEFVVYHEEYAGNGGTTGCPTTPPYNLYGFEVAYAAAGTSSLTSPAGPLPTANPNNSYGVVFGLFGSTGNDPLRANYSPMEIVSPFLLAADSDLGDIALPSLLRGLPSFASVTANGLAADGASAAIVLLPVNANNADVTFTANNGTTLLLYHSDFLKRTPEIGGSTLVVKAKDIFAVSSLYYAAALLQAPLAGVTPSYATPITVTAQQQGGPQQQVTLPLVPPPVLLVHGIWGTAHSLDFYKDTLTTTFPWASNTSFVYESSYSAVADFASTGSIHTIEAEIRNELGDLQDQGIVVSRTDIVAHSMGGLLVRSTSQGSSAGACDQILMRANTAPYRSLVNRCQGQFHTIVTLDTPEAGSKMALYLIDNQDATLQATDDTDPNAYNFWLLVCGSDPDTTVAQCLAKTNPVTGGGLASLVPTSNSLQQAPPPTITNATWVAITATNTTGIARKAIALLIRAIYNDYSSALSINDILGGVNDDVVALKSQLTGNPPTYVTDKGLAHVGFLRHGIDEGVNNSLLAASQTACWLQDPSSPACASVAVNTVALSAGEPGIDSAQSLKPTRGRLTLSMPTAAALGKPFTLHISATGVKSFEVDQLAQLAQAGRMASSFNEVVNANPSASGGYDVTTLPHVIGRATFAISAQFADGGFDEVRQNIDVEVDPAQITGLRAEPQFKKLRMSMVVSSYQLSPVISVQGLVDPVDVGAYATYRVLSSNADPAITIDHNGLIKCVHPGDAKVEVEFEGHSDTVSVVVGSGSE